jgi:hypothetical protein
VADYRKSTSLFSKYRDPGGISTGELLDRYYNIPEGRTTAPLSYLDNVDFPHRIFDFHYNFRLGDCQFKIPPEFIQVKTITETNSVVGIRQSTSLKTKSGYSRKQIVITLFFNGLNQINGYKCESPFSYPYYMDGLRSLLAQFKRTPFLPVVNELINGVHGIYNVALSNITINTVQGFPECLQAELTLLDFNVVPLIEAPPFMYHNMIDWDMFRWYYQQLLRPDDRVYDRNEHATTRLQPIQNTNLTGKFGLYILSEEALAAMNDGKYKPDLSDSSNYILCVDDETGIRLTDIFCGYSNVLPAIQLSKEGTPTYQYLGGTDATFTFIFETQDRDVVTALVDLNERCQRMVREYRKLHGLGFIKIENELVQMLGAQYVMFNTMDITTVPDFPDLFRIQIEAVSYDIDQSKKETLTGMKPFDGDGTLLARKVGTTYDWTEVAEPNTTITNTYMGLITKIRQDNYIEHKMKLMDLYPDLQLPTFEELDDFITTIREWRRSKGLQAYPLSGPYPKDDGRIKFSDPDFYVFYPIKYGDAQNIITGTGGNVGGETYDPDDGAISVAGIFKSGLYGATETTPGQHPKTQELLKLLESKIGCGYVWGAEGEILTQEGLAALKKQFGASHYDFVDDDGTRVLASKWIGKQVFDCSGFINWGLIQVGIAPKGYRTTHSTTFNDWCIEIKKSEILPGDIAMNSTHIAMISDPDKDQTIEAMGTRYGVVHGKIGNRFTKFGRLKGGKTKSSTTPTPNAATQQVSKAQTTDYNAKRDAYNPTYQAIYDYANIQCTKLGVPIRLMCAMMEIESNWTQWWTTAGKKADGKYHNAGDVVRSYANAVGICQIVHHSPNGTPVNNQYDYDKLQNDWRYNIECGAKELYECYKGASQRFTNEEDRARAAWCAYNMGRYASQSYTRWRDNPNRDDIKFKEYYEKQPWLSRIDTAKIPTSNGTDYTGSVEVPETDLSVTNNFASLNFNREEFGKDIRRLSDIHGGVKETKNFNGHKQDKYPIEHMCHDMTQYNKRGRLLRAFPTFIFMMLDENGDWLDGKKLWTNYYFYRSIMDIQIHQDRKQPVHTAIIKISNVYNNLGKSPPREYDWVKEQMGGGIQGWLYETFGIQVGTPKATQSMVENKNKVLKHVYLDAGCRIHLRIGYGNDAEMLPITFTGQITEMDTAEIITFVAQSDGVELINRAVGTNNKSQTNTLFNIGTEPSNIIKSLLCDRESDFISWCNHKWYENSKYGIQHFGTPTLVDDTGFVKFNIDRFVDVSMNMAFDTETMKMVQAIKAEKNPMAAIGEYFEQTFKDWKWTDPSTWWESFKNMFKVLAALTLEAGMKLELSVGQAIVDFVAGNYKNMSWPEYYDIIKNIYLGGIKGDEERMEDYAAIHMNLNGKLAIDPFDGEENLRVFIYNKCVWDIMQVVTQSIPEFVCQPMYHQFETRVFFGHPFWLAKYKYYYDAKDRKIYEHEKPFTQFHLYDSLSDIIDNQIKADGRGLATNIIGMYTLGHSLKTTPTIFADKTIAWDYQKTRVIDTSFVQNWFGPDMLYEFFDDYKAERTAIRICTSNLIDGFQCIYKGPLIVIGDSSVKPCDIIGITDSYTGMYGLAEVREVSHSFSVDTGFVTSITPDLYTTGAGFMMKQDAQSVFLSLAMGFGGIVAQRSAGIFAANTAVRYAAAGTGVAIGLVAIRVGGLIIDGFRTGRILLNVKDFADTLKTAKEIKNLTKTIKEVKNIKTAVNVAKQAGMAAKSIQAEAALLGTEILPGIGTIVLWLAATIATECLLKAVVDFFSYQNCIKCFPLLYNGKPFIAGVKGHTQLIPGYNDMGMLADDTSKPIEEGIEIEGEYANSSAGTASGGYDDGLGYTEGPKMSGGQIDGAKPGEDGYMPGAGLYA